VQNVRKAVGRYEVVRELGRGGMATVYLARQVDLSRLVALKELAALRRSDPTFAQRFLREARLAGSDGHPNIITVHDLFEHVGTPYIAMEYAESGSLRAYMGRMSLSQVGGMLESVLAGLAAAEKQWIVHRDLKPENLLVTGAGRVKIADFGIAKATNKLAGPGLTSLGATVGTPNYMAPEQALAHDVGPWTDLYSVGIIAFECFIGLPPFGATEEPMGVLLRQVNETIPSVSALDPGIDPRISGWIDRMVSKEPRDRPQSADEAWDELEDTLIALLGPRWRRDALLPPLPDVPLLPGPETPPPFDAPLGPLTEAHLGAFGDLPTVRNDDMRAARTIPPRQPQAPLAPTAVQPAPKRRRGWSKLLFVGVAVVALAAGALARTGGSLQPTPGAGTGTEQGATPTAPAQVAAVGGVQQIQDQGPAGENLAAQAKSAHALALRYDNAADDVARLKSAQVKGSPGARLVTALRQTAKAYGKAESAALRGDIAGYTAALAEVETSKQAVNAALVDMGGTPPQSSGSPQPSQPGSPQPTQPASSCAGDSASDDPSDDDCEA